MSLELDEHFIFVKENKRASIKKMRELFINKSHIFKHTISLGLININGECVDVDIPINMLMVLSEDKNAYIRLNVAINPNCPLKLLIRLSNDLNNKVSAAANYFRRDRLNLLK